MTTSASITFEPSKGQVRCQGEWNLSHCASLQTAFKKLTWPTSGRVILNGSELSKLDSAGCWLLLTYCQTLEKKGLSVHREGFSTEATTLLNLVAAKMPVIRQSVPVKPLNGIAAIGRVALQQATELYHYFSFIGQLAIDAIALIRRPSQFRLGPLVNTIHKTGYQALAIIALLSFMIGVVIAYQMGFQLRNYGANVFIVDLLGLSVLREFGPLLTAIMVAGRTGSAFTAQLGIMKMNQEIDALNTMGVSPSSLLLLPRLIGLILALPLLTIWSDLFGMIGGILMANNMLGVTWHDFLLRFEREIPVRALFIGLGKAPVFAFIIASISCFEGMQVEGNAESIGTKTTRSVVLAIFFIIIADAIFSILFSKLRL